MKKLKKALKWLPILLFTGIGIAAGYFAGQMGYSAASGTSKITVISIVCLFIPVFFAVIGFHEAGHAFMGVKVKFDFRMYIIGPFMWEKEQNGWKFKWNKNVNTAGGLVVCLPTDRENLSKRFSLYAAGGPLASLILSIMSYLGYRLLSLAGTDGNIMLKVSASLLLLMSVMSIAIFVVTALPLHNGGFSSDGARVLRLLGGGEKAEFEVLILKIFTGSAGGIRPRDLDQDELTNAKNLAEKLNAPLGVYLHGYFHQAAFDKGEFTKAEIHLQDYIHDAGEIPAGIRNSVWLDAAFFYAFVKADISEAEKYWNQYKPTALIPKAQVFATEAAMAFIKNDMALSLSKTEESLKEIPNMMDRGLGIALREKLLELKAKIEARG